MTPLPSLRSLTASLRETHAAFAHPIAGGEYVCLVDAGPEVGWVIECADHPDGVGREWVPGDGSRFDAVASARRLLTAALDGLAPQREAV
jgi:hypothetical protein